MSCNTGIFTAARECLVETGWQKKTRLSRQYSDPAFLASTLFTPAGAAEPVPAAGFPAKPELVHPGSLPRRGFSTVGQRLAMLHAIAHIEFNAINIAWDAVFRYQRMPRDFTLDWVRIAGEETRHFCMLNDLLARHGMCYGDLPAHKGLWDMVERTADDVLWRMAIIPRVYEARGLDVTPQMINQFRAAGDDEAARLLAIIYKDEIGHVKTGNYWFNFICGQRCLQSESTFFELFDRFAGRQPATKLNLRARKTAGFSDSELAYLSATRSRSGD